MKQTNLAATHLLSRHQPPASPSTPTFLAFASATEIPGPKINKQAHPGTGARMRESRKMEGENKSNIAAACRAMNKKRKCECLCEGFRHKQSAYNGGGSTLDCVVFLLVSFFFLQLS